MVFSTLSAQPHSSAASYFCSCRNWRDDGTANDPKPDLPQKTNMRQKKVLDNGRPVCPKLDNFRRQQLVACLKTGITSVSDY
ncbi:hypothetical protein AVEN_30727-1 [Araneus ventricosus]|uniref:Uncharacterized protein n=1 Tax=Araneus ventricosus TaxID=182803 RepID=A0A4Y2X3D8_ARAVE|nr:hypothetical protein AVEN_222522-1 [Araneus ventricosus]GBO44081.1 hypothetical protein AVEN_30727-1 [Araneus ventricosus]